MVTINFNFPADTGQKKDQNIAINLPTPESSSGEQAGTGVAPTPLAAGTALASEKVPAPASVFSASAQTDVPKPTDFMVTEKAGGAAPPTPMEGEGALAGAPQPTAEVKETSRKTKQGQMPTPQDQTALAKEVNKEIEKAQKKPTRRRTSTKKK